MVQQTGGIASLRARFRKKARAGILQRQAKRRTASQKTRGTNTKLVRRKITSPGVPTTCLLLMRAAAFVRACAIQPGEGLFSSSLQSLHK